MINIVSKWYDHGLLFSYEGSDRVHAVNEAISRNIDLSQADFGRVDLSHMDFKKVNLCRTDFSGSSLRHSNLSGCNLSFAQFDYADLRGTILDGAIINWNSHDLLSEILFRAAKNTPQRQVAGLVLVSRNWCWNEFLFVGRRHNQRDWAIKTLCEYIQPNDPYVPLMLRIRYEKLKKLKKIK